MPPSSMKINLLYNDSLVHVTLAVTRFHDIVSIAMNSFLISVHA